jgi:hypothetical protein
VTVQWIGPAWLRRPAEAVGLGTLYQRVTKLSLTGPQFDDRVVQHLVKLRRLESLALSNTKVSDAGITRLRRALPHCQIEQDPLGSGVPNSVFAESWFGSAAPRDAKTGF